MSSFPCASPVQGLGPCPGPSSLTPFQLAAEIRNNLGSTSRIATTFGFVIGVSGAEVILFTMYFKLAQCTKLQRKGTHTARWSEQHPCSLQGLLDPSKEDPVFILIRENGLQVPTVSNLILVPRSSNNLLVGQIRQSFDKILETPAEIAADDFLCRAPPYRKAWHLIANR